MGLRKLLRKRYYFLLIKIAIHTPDLVEARRGALLFAKTPTIHIYIQASDIYEQRHTSKNVIVRQYFPNVRQNQRPGGHFVRYECKFYFEPYIHQGPL